MWAGRVLPVGPRGGSFLPLRLLGAGCSLLGSRLLPAPLSACDCLAREDSHGVEAPLGAAGARLGILLNHITDSLFPKEDVSLGPNGDK